MTRPDRPWPTRLVVREGVATALVGRWTSLLVIAAVAWACAAVGAADAVGVSETVRREREWIDAGAYVLRVQGTVRGEEQLPVPPTACEDLARVDGVHGTFWAVRRAAAGSFAHVPGGRFSVLEVSPGALAFLGVETPLVPTVLVSDGLARRTGVTDDSPVRVSGSDVLRARVASVAVLGDDFDGTLLAPSAPASRADMCFVRTDAGHVAAVTALASSELGWDGSDAVASPRLFENEFTVDFARAHEQRDLRWAWVAAGAVLALLWALVQWFRRSHTAIYATFGVTTAGRAVLQVSEWAVLAIAGLIWGWTLGVVGAVALGAEARFALTQVTAQAVPAVLLATALVVLLSARPTGTLLDQLKDR